MCNITEFHKYLEDLEDYLEFVNTDVDKVMAYEPDMYAAYATHKQLELSEIKNWYQEAENNYVSALGVELYLQHKYDAWSEEDIDYFYEKEVHKDGILFECSGYWFTTE